MHHTLRTRSRILTIALVLTTLVSWYRPSTVMAQAGEAEHVAILLILDDSGSMKDNDPTDLRYAAARLFVSLLDDGDAVGAVRFSSGSTAITNGIQVIADSNARTDVVEKLKPVESDGYTDVKTAFEEAHRLLQAFNASNYETVAIFLTDGKPEIAAPYPTYQQEAVEAARLLGMPFMSVALTSTGQTPFLTHVANETEGRVILARDAGDLLDVYLQLLGDIKDRTVIGSGDTEAPGKTTVSLNPALMPYVDRVSFVVGKSESTTARLVSPDGQELGATNTMATFGVQDDRFAVYTLDRPAAGDWSFDIDGEGSAQARAILYSRLRVQLLSPTGLFATDRPLVLAVRLVEEKADGTAVNIIGDAQFAAWITRPDGTQDSLDRFYDDGTHGDQIAGDGLYSREYVNTGLEGNYEVEIQGTKGSVPVAYKTQVQGIAVPRMVVDEPAEPTYLIRGDSVPLGMSLKGADWNTLDSGEIHVTVIAPDGTKKDITLARSQDRYTGAFHPLQDGAYELRFEAIDATYQGITYQDAVEATIQVQIVPTVVAQGMSIATAGGQQGIPRIDRMQARDGIYLTLDLASTSTAEETLTANLADLPNFILDEGTQFQVPPKTETTINLRLIADANVGAQVFDGTLNLTAASTVDLVGGMVPLTFELFDPTLRITPTVYSHAAADSCRTWAPVTLSLTILLDSTREEAISLALDDDSGIALSQETVTVPPGTSTVDVTLLAPNRGFVAGDYTTRLVFKDLRPGLVLIGDSSRTISFTVDPIWVSCRKQLVTGGIGIAVGLLVAFLILRRAVKGRQPPRVSGTLVYWPTDDRDESKSINLTPLKQKIITIGTSDENDVTVSDNEMKAQHLAISVEHGADNELIYKAEPLQGATIKQGYNSQTSALQIDDATEFEAGSTTFKFISDPET